MKCIHCGADSKYRERIGGACPLCRKDFAFEPMKRDKLTDAAFKDAIDKVSAGGHVRFGIEHLHYETARRVKSWHAEAAPGCGCATMALSLVFSIPVIAELGPVGIMLPAIGMPLGIVLCFIMPKLLGRRPGLRLSAVAFDRMWRRWIEVHGKPAGVIERPKDAERPERPHEPDIEDYSFDRAVICDRARTVDLLLANNFHFENNCAVLSVGGYPKRAFATVKKMIRKNPRLRVFALHDCTPEGCTLAHRLANDADWFKFRGRVIDVGIRPGNVKVVAGICLPAYQPVRPGSSISPDEAAWLSQWSLELAALRPEKILKSLFKAINAYPEPDEPRETATVAAEGRKKDAKKKKDSDGEVGLDIDGDDHGDGHGDGGGSGHESGHEEAESSVADSADTVDAGTDSFG